MNQTFGKAVIRAAFETLLIVGVIALLATAQSAWAMPSQEKLTLIHERWPGSFRHHKISKFYLEKNDREITCRTDGFPPHRIRVRGLRNFKPVTVAIAAANSPGLPRCRELVHWGKQSFCYHKYDVPMVDDVLRQCAN